MGKSDSNFQYLHHRKNSRNCYMFNQHTIHIDQTQPLPSHTPQGRPPEDGNASFHPSFSEQLVPGMHACTQARSHQAARLLRCAARHPLLLDAGQEEGEEEEATPAKREPRVLEKANVLSRSWDRCLRLCVGLPASLAPTASQPLLFFPCSAHARTHSRTHALAIVLQPPAARRRRGGFWRRSAMCWSHLLPTTYLPTYCT
ncbi:hypothetical protein IWX47DRAFT_342571 [Phyllosticta citricarpa]